MNEFPGQINIFNAEMPPLKIDRTKNLVLIELFAGIGAQAKALENLGVQFEHRICEFDRFAVASYNAVHGTDFKPSDIRNLHAEDLGITDKEHNFYVCFYSFPCQDLSNAGLQKGMSKNAAEQTRSGLLWQVERLLYECRDQDGCELPDILIMENVPQVHGKRNIADFTQWTDSLKELGYTSVWKDLNAKDFGIPQSRNRTFMVSWLGEHSYEFPEAVPLNEKSLSTKTIPSRCVQIGMLNDEKYRKFHEICRRVYSPAGCAPACVTHTGGGQEIKVIEYVWMDKETENRQSNRQNVAD